jgi:hypothetical protein
MKSALGLMARTTTVGALLLCSGCAVIAVADTVVTVAATVVPTGVKAAGAAVHAVIPESKKAP